MTLTTHFDNEPSPVWGVLDVQAETEGAACRAKAVVEGLGQSDLGFEQRQGVGI